MSTYDSQGRTIHPVTRRDIPLVKGGQGRSDLEVERGATLFAVVCVVLIGLCIAAVLVGGGA